MTASVVTGAKVSKLSRYHSESWVDTYQKIFGVYNHRDRPLGPAPFFLLSFFLFLLSFLSPLLSSTVYSSDKLVHIDHDSTARYLD